MRKVSLVFAILTSVFTLIMLGGYIINMLGAVELDVMRLTIFAGLFVAVITPSTITAVINDVEDDGRRFK